MKTYKLFLDDIKDPTQVFNYTKNEMYNTKDWIVVRNYESFINTIQSNYKNNLLPSIISFDHDISDYDTNNKELTGVNCARWLKLFFNTNNIQLPMIFVHSMNSVGRINILREFNDN